MTLFTVRHKRVLAAFYSVDPEDLTIEPPGSLEFDARRERPVVSLVGYDLSHFKFAGIPVFQSFPVLQLRYYAKDGSRHGFVPVKTFVPGRITSWFRSLGYGEHCEHRPMKSKFKKEDRVLKYRLRIKLEIHREKLETAGREPLWEAPDNSDEGWLNRPDWAFIPSGENGFGRVEFQHSNWKLYHVESFENTIAFEAFFGEEWAFLVEEEPITTVFSPGGTIELGIPS